jgi:hypothetical protein
MIKMTLTCLIAGLLSSAVMPAYADSIAKTKPERLSIKKMGSFSTGIFDDSAAEINAYDPKTKRVFITNA